MMTALLLVLSGCSTVQTTGQTSSLTRGAAGIDVASASVQSDARGSAVQRNFAPVAGPANTLSGAVAAALNYNAAVREASTRSELSDIEVDIARSGYLPVVQGAAEVGQDGVPDWQVTLRQPLFDWGRTGAQVDQAQATNSAAGFELMAAREQAAFEAAQAYIGVKRSEALVEAARENLAAYRRLTQLAKDRVQGGIGDNSEVELAGVHEGEAQAALEDALGVLRNARIMFEARMGYTPQNLAPIPNLPLALGDIADIRAAAMRSPAVAAAMARGEAANHAIEAERANLLPTLSLEGFARTETPLFGDRSVNTGVGIKLTSPTLAGFSNFQRVEAADLAANEVRWTAEKSIRDAMQQVQAYQAQAPGLRNRANILEEQLERAMALRVLYEDQFKFGDRGVSDLSAVLADVYRVDVSIINARHDIFELQYAAAGSLGLLQESLAAVEGPRHP
ncbi:TolC family protein [Pelagibacterium halotolerans]|uniref:TolC family protein n=1 Tax=Pelagibacterium halotolerans TaxID=531813 RepID=UPI00385167CF